MAVDPPVNPGAAPALRLVRPDSGGRANSLHLSDGGAIEGLPLARARVASENKGAALGAGDARWAMACRVATRIEGGRSAVIRPEVRERLVTQARLLGLRAFDANLIIAIVQDAARTGREPLDDEVAARLRLVRAPEVEARSVWPMVAASIALGAAVLAALIVWVG